MVLYIRCRWPIALFYGVTFIKLMGITGSHSEIGGCDRNRKWKMENVPAIL